MKIQLILLTALFGFTACVDEQQNADIISANIEISVKAIDGSDLLDPENPDSFNESKIKIYHLIDGNFKEVYDSHLDAPKGFLIFELPDSVFRIRIFGNIMNGINQATSLVKWNANDSDTLKYEIYRSERGSTIGITKVWFNDIEMWSETSQTERYFEIIK